MKNKRISQFFGSDKPKLHIKDYTKINEIFNLYLDQKYDTMAREIYWYKQFNFFVELAIYLNKHFKTDIV